ncbi:MAG: menaquinone biosynthesis protein [Planctomycetota bacterium]
MTQDVKKTEPPKLGCVSYLNAKPLIHGLPPAPEGGIDLTLDVPSRLIGRLLNGEVDLALCSIADLFAHRDRVELVPVGGIGCAGPTWTVRLFSRVPAEAVRVVHADTDSHTSVQLLRVLLREMYGHDPELIHYDARRRRAGGRDVPPGHPPEAVLLIGDKVVTDGPAATVYPYQLDLGAAWHDLTGKPFVFAAWLKRRGDDLGTLPNRLADRLHANLRRVDAIAERYAEPHGWPIDLASRYLGEVLRYRLGPAELDAIAHFERRLAALPRPAAATD